MKKIDKEFEEYLNSNCSDFSTEEPNIGFSTFNDLHQYLKNGNASIVINCLTRTQLLNCLYNYGAPSDKYLYSPIAINFIVLNALANSGNIILNAIVIIVAAFLTISAYSILISIGFIKSFIALVVCVYLTSQIFNIHYLNLFFISVLSAYFLEYIFAILLTKKVSKLVLADKRLLKFMINNKLIIVIKKYNMSKKEYIESQQNNKFEKEYIVSDNTQNNTNQNDLLKNTEDIQNIKSEPIKNQKEIENISKKIYELLISNTYKGTDIVINTLKESNRNLTEREITQLLVNNFSISLALWEIHTTNFPPKIGIDNFTELIPEISKKIIYQFIDNFEESGKSFIYRVVNLNIVNFIVLYHDFTTNTSNPKTHTLENLTTFIQMCLHLSNKEDYNLNDLSYNMFFITTFLDYILSFGKKIDCLYET